MKLVTGNSNRALAEAVSDYLELPLTDCTVKRFADKEIFVEIHENVRGEDVFILQSTSFPANDNLMELLILDRRAAPLLGPPHHRRHPLFRLCPAGPQIRLAAPRSRPSSSPISSPRPASTASSRSICTPPRSRASSISRPTTSIGAPVIIRDIQETLRAPAT